MHWTSSYGIAVNERIFESQNGHLPIIRYVGRAGNFPRSTNNSQKTRDVFSNICCDVFIDSIPQFIRIKQYWYTTKVIGVGVVIGVGASNGGGGADDKGGISPTITDAREALPVANDSVAGGPEAGSTIDGWCKLLSRNVEASTARSCCRHRERSWRSTIAFMNTST